MEGGDGQAAVGDHADSLVVSEQHERLEHPTPGPPPGMCECAVCGECCIKKKKSSHT